MRPVLAVALAVVGLAPAYGRDATPARVTMIGDSVADEISYVGSARALLGRGLRLDLELAACRRLVEPSCTVARVQPPTALELIHAQGRALGSTVVVAVGYNDYELPYHRDVERVLGALRRAGVRHVLWLTLRAARHPYVTMNATLRQLAAGDSRLTLLDWNRHSRSHPSWFGADGLHLTPAGAMGMARLVRVALGRLNAT
jgi:hypothetical protein